MTQQPDLTIPFDASVVDEEAMRTLRAVQRTVPMDGAAASGNLMGGTEAVAAFGMVPGAPSGGGLARSQGIVPLSADPIARPGDTLLEALDTPTPRSASVALDAALPEPPGLVSSAALYAAAAPKSAASRGSSGYLSSTPGSPIVPELETTQTTSPEEQSTVTAPDVDEPESEEPQDTAAASPLVQAAAAEGQEDQPIALNLSAALADTDGSELLSIKIFGVPEGASLTHGTRQSDGSWSVSPADLPDLAFIPPSNFSGTFNLTLRATSQEVNGEMADVEVSFQVQVHAVADVPGVTVANAHGQEDMPVNLAGLAARCAIRTARRVSASFSAAFPPARRSVPAPLSAVVAGL